MSAPCQSVCTPWATTADLPEPCASTLDDLDAGMVDDALWIASDILFNLTGRRWPGWCQDTVRPCAQYAPMIDTRRSGRSFATYVGAWVDTTGVSFCSCNRTQVCGCGSLSQISLGETPITGVVSVKIDGDTVAPARYRVDDYRWLVYLPDPDDPTDRDGWPCCQDLGLASTEDGTFEVTYTTGTAPPPGGRRSAAEYACQLVLGWTGNGACQLPKDATLVSRQGITASKVSPMELAREGMVGLRDVDTWVASVLLGDKRRPAVVVVPEFSRSKVRRVGT